jgi:hypothetical protein
MNKKNHSNVLNYKLYDSYLCYDYNNYLICYFGIKISFKPNIINRIIKSKLYDQEIDF